ncbi:MAG: MarR family winged helix-turn-helix transcriptional regulator [Culicoidibacterales bacterium]
MSEKDILLLENQLCFSLYAVSKEVIRLYKPILDPHGLTYTQYITLLAIWGNDTVSVKELGKQLHLDSGTLTPVLKKLELQGYVNRQRDYKDERILLVTTTEKGRELKEKLAAGTTHLACLLQVNSIDLQQLKKDIDGLLRIIIDNR